MFGNLIDGSQKEVWSLPLEFEILQNYENCSNIMIFNLCIVNSSVIHVHVCASLLSS